MFQSYGIATGFAEDTKRRFHAEPSFEHDIEKLDVMTSDVPAHPLVEDSAEEFAELTGFDRPLGNLCRGRAGRENQRQLIRVGRCSHALDYGNELHEAAADRLQKLIYFDRVAGVVLLHAGQGVELDMVFLNELKPLHHLLERRRATPIHAIVIVHFARTVD